MMKKPIFYPFRRIYFGFRPGLVAGLRKDFILVSGLRQAFLVIGTFTLMMTDKKRKAVLDQCYRRHLRKCTVKSSR